MLVLASAAVIAGGYIINNFYDDEKDLINKPIEQYNEINKFRDENTNLNIASNNLNENENKNENEMQNELKSFLNKIKKEEILTADVLNSSNYSTY